MLKFSVGLQGVALLLGRAGSSDCSTTRRWSRRCTTRPRTPAPTSAVVAWRSTPTSGRRVLGLGDLRPPGRESLQRVPTTTRSAAARRTSATCRASATPPSSGPRASPRAEGKKKKKKKFAASPGSWPASDERLRHEAGGEELVDLRSAPTSTAASGRSWGSAHGLADLHEGRLHDPATRAGSRPTRSSAA